MRLTNLSFEEWIEHAFGPAVRHHGAAWYFDPDCDWWDPPPPQAVAYFTRLFEGPEPALRWFHDSQVAQGLTYLVDTCACGDSRWFSAPTVPVADRLRCVAAVGTLFERLFAPRCTPHLGHLSEVGGPLNTVCYMWWDTFPAIALPDDPHRAALEDAALQVMDRTLTLDSLACRESALHGLGHWHRVRGSAVEGIIDRWLADGCPRDPRLEAYARAARTGCVL